MSEEQDANRYLITANEISSEEGLSKTHFLNLNAQRINKSLGDLTGITGFGFHIIEVEPGRETTEYHVHHHEDECVYVLEGNATAIVGKEAYEIGPGDFLGYRKGGLAHSIQNTGTVTLRCIVVGERLSHDVGDYPNKGKRIFRNAGLPWNLVDHNSIEEPQAGAKK
ncbi:cupin domain-containing protein [Aliiroseovarius sediminis]|uniref:cupin domain-containing protein n=1 Tax=Aliiroseovarius sediminis TaxID=2925839 RepID=UPI001F5ACB93|nr:cupin domain-containing protein [Aliiroseovarius sediminis]MCI2394457.1 cupin domain-containing protein [Aliiroseovarius sediminis]